MPVDGDGSPFLAEGLGVIGRLVNRVVDQILSCGKFDRLFACKLSSSVELRQRHVLHTLVGHAGVLVGTDLLKREAASIGKLLVRQIARKPRVHLGGAGHAFVPIGDERLHIRGGGAVARLPKAIDLVALSLDLLDCGGLLLFPAVPFGRHRFHIGGVERHETRTDRCVELGILFQLIGEHRRQAEAC